MNSESLVETLVKTTEVTSQTAFSEPAPIEQMHLNLTTLSISNADFDGDELNIHVSQSIQTNNEMLNSKEVTSQIAFSESTPTKNVTTPTKNTLVYDKKKVLLNDITPLSKNELYMFIVSIVNKMNEVDETVDRYISCCRHLGDGCIFTEEFFRTSEFTHIRHKLAMEISERVKEDEAYFDLLSNLVECIKSCNKINSMVNKYSYQQKPPRYIKNKNFKLNKMDNDQVTNTGQEENDEKEPTEHKEQIKNDHNQNEHKRNEHHNGYKHKGYKYNTYKKPMRNKFRNEQDGDEAHYTGSILEKRRKDNDKRYEESRKDGTVLSGILKGMKINSNQ